MMGFRHLVIVALGATQAWTASAGQVKRQDATAKYCPGGTPICFSEYSVDAQGVVYRIAIPDVQAAPFDILLQIVAPKTVGWAAIAWGGKMTSNPLTVAWPNANTAIVSSRWTSGKSMPGAYTGAKYTVLPTTTSNSSHWQLDVLCQGCSKWQGGELNPNGANALAWAKNNRAVVTPSSNTSNFAGHDARGIFSHDLSQAKIPKGIFDAVAYDLENNAPTSAVVVPPQPSVATSVVTLPKPASSSKPILPIPESSVLGPLPIPTRLTVLPGEPTSASRTGRVVTSVTQLVPKPRTSTVYVIPSPKPVTTVVTVIVTAKPPATTARATPTPTPWSPPDDGDDGESGGGAGGGWGGGGWGGGGGRGGGWGKGKGGGGRGGGPGRGRRPGEEEE